MQEWHVRILVKLCYYPLTQVFSLASWNCLLCFEHLCFAVSPNPHFFAFQIHKLAMYRLLHILVVVSRRSIDGGNSWEALSSSLYVGNIDFYTATVSVDGKTVYIILEAGGNVVIKSDDAGIVLYYATTLHLRQPRIIDSKCIV